MSDHKMDEILGVMRCEQCGHRLEGEIECPFCSSFDNQRLSSRRRKGRGPRDRLSAIVEEWWQVFFWLFVFIVVAAVGYGHDAPLLILYRLFRFTAFIFLLMFMPCVTGLVGFTKAVRRGWQVALAIPLALAGIYYLIYHESIWKLWYQGEFTREYVMGLAEAAVIVPGLSFLAGLVFRHVLK